MLDKLNTLLLVLLFAFLIWSRPPQVPESRKGPEIGRYAPLSVEGPMLTVLDTATARVYTMAGNIQGTQERLGFGVVDLTRGTVTKIGEIAK